jgi:hypothetical protein
MTQIQKDPKTGNLIATIIRELVEPRLVEVGFGIYLTIIKKFST